jgi:hypothetical protein
MFTVSHGGRAAAVTNITKFQACNGGGSGWREQRMTWITQALCPEFWMPAEACHRARQRRDPVAGYDDRDEARETLVRHSGAR